MEMRTKHMLKLPYIYIFLYSMMNSGNLCGSQISTLFFSKKQIFEVQKAEGVKSGNKVEAMLFIHSCTE